MRPAVLMLARTVLLAGPTVIAFLSGGYFAGPQTFGAAVAWGLVLLAAVLTDRPLPRRAAGRLALAGLAAFGGWVALSMLWAPQAEPAFRDAQRLLLYVGVLIAAAALLRGRSVVRAIEPALAAGIAIVVGYGLSGRLLPGLIDVSYSQIADGRLDQPLTYWNAMGALAAIGFLLCTRLVGDEERAIHTRALAAAASAGLGAGVYISLSRGALGALALGLLVLVILAPTRSQLRALGVVLPAGGLAVVAAILLPGFAELKGDGNDELIQQGAIMLVVLVVLSAAAALAAVLLARAERGRLRTGALPISRRTAAIAAVLPVLAAAALVFITATERESGGPARFERGSERLTSFESDRSAYWRVAIDGGLDNPLNGVGSSGFAVEWLRERPFFSAANDAHSLYIETFAELGLVGLALLGIAFGGVAVSARWALRHDRRAAAGLVSVLALWALHAALDWDWEMPGVTLVALIIAGAVVALADAGDEVVEPADDSQRVVATGDAGSPGANARSGAQVPVTSSE